MSASKDQTCRDYNQNEEPGACNLCNEHECNDFSGVTKPFASILSIFVAVIVALKMH